MQPSSGLALALAWSAVALAPSAGPAQDEPPVDEIVVTATRGDRLLSETPLAVGAVLEQTIDQVRPGHPSEIFERIPGVHVNVTSGEGHMTAIRQPITTSPLYLFLEDGVPVRSTGFFNHNALYEVNLPQSGRLEVIRGPGTSLHGSDAIGAVLNAFTRPPAEDAELGGTLELGGDGWRRLLLSGGGSRGLHAFRIDANLTGSDGWRDFTDYERKSVGLRIDSELGTEATLKTVVSFSDVDQTRAAAHISEADYRRRPSFNPDDISFREVDAFRVSTALELPAWGGRLSLTPYFRYNAMDLMPDWQFSFDPQVWESRNYSVGMLAKHERELPGIGALLIAGVDVDYSPGEREEYQVFNTTGLACGFRATPSSRCLRPDPDGVHRTYRRGATQYDYDVTFFSVSPYAQLELSPVEALRVTAGLRLDRASFDYDSSLAPLHSGAHRRPDDERARFSHSSAKLGLTYAFRPDLSGYVSYRHGFRVPSERALFRQGAAENTVDLEPIKADSFDVGLRGAVLGRVRFDLAAYQMRLRDDIVSIRTLTSRLSENAGETLHRGIELGLGAELHPALSISLAYSASQHRYEDWQAGTGQTFDGNRKESAPRDVGNAVLRSAPELLNGGALEVEWVHLGRYWMDPENEHRYDGHDLLNLRLDARLESGVELFARLMNALDTRYAHRASFNAFRGEELAPGRPRTLYAGVSYRWH